MKTLTVRDLPDQIHARFLAVAAQNHRSAEAHARFLIEREAQAEAAETCGELIDRIWNDPAPEVDPEVVESFLAQRGRRSPRP